MATTLKQRPNALDPLVHPVLDGYECDSGGHKSSSGPTTASDTFLENERAEGGGYDDARLAHGGHRCCRSEAQSDEKQAVWGEDEEPGDDRSDVHLGAKRGGAAEGQDDPGIAKGRDDHDELEIRERACSLDPRVVDQGVGGDATCDREPEAGAARVGAPARPANEKDTAPDQADPGRLGGR